MIILFVWLCFKSHKGYTFPAGWGRPQKSIDALFQAWSELTWKNTKSWAGFEYTEVIGKWFEVNDIDHMAINTPDQSVTIYVGYVHVYISRGDSEKGLSVCK